MIMKNIKNLDKFKKIISAIFLIMWCLLIFYFSNQNGELSKVSSSRIIDFLNQIFKINLYEFKYSILIVRKIAHMFLYFVLFLLSINFFRNYKITNYYKYAFIFCLTYALSDEVHQLFIIERSFKLTDVLIDMIGSSFGYIFCKLINKLNF